MSRKIKIAYLGYKMYNKGWETWERLYNNIEITNEYDLYHIGTPEVYSKYVKTANYSFIDDGMMAPVKLLNEKEIDLVLLWSIVPESYSYTLYETIASGVPVLCNVKSGNIAATVSKDINMGRVFLNETELFQFLSNKEAVIELIELNRKEYKLEFNPLPFI
jgi:hypothetical protein